MHTILSVELPLWVLFIATVGVILASVEGGYRWADLRQRLHKNEKEAPVGAMVGATLALLAFILGFSFNMAADAFQARKLAVVNEANAIRSAYLQAGLIPESPRSQVRALLREYLHERLQWVGAEPNQTRRSGEVLLGDLWEHAYSIGGQSSGNAGPFLDSLNEVTHLRAERVSLRERSRIPLAYRLALLALAILAHVAMGYHGGVAGTARSPVMLVVALAFSLVMLLIADIDRPGQGLINVDQEALTDLRRWMAKSNP